MEITRRIHLKHRADTFENVTNVLLVPENPMVATQMFGLSLIGEKLAGPYHVLHKHYFRW